MNGKRAVFLLDSGSEGKTASMVKLFMENMKSESFSKMMKDQFISITDKCVEDFLKSNLLVQNKSKILFNFSK